jgi:hypothetical protein
MEMILLTKEQADKVRGRHGQYSALDPIEIEGGYFMLPVDVLKDPEHKEVLEALMKCEAAVIKETLTVNKKLPVEDPLREKVTYSVLSKTAMKQEWLPEEMKISDATVKEEEIIRPE